MQQPKDYLNSENFIDKIIFRKTGNMDDTDEMRTMLAAFVEAHPDVRKTTLSGLVSWYHANVLVRALYQICARQAAAVAFRKTIYRKIAAQAAIVGEFMEALLAIITKEKFAGRLVAYAVHTLKIIQKQRARGFNAKVVLDLSNEVVRRAGEKEVADIMAGIREASE